MKKKKRQIQGPDDPGDSSLQLLSNRIWFLCNSLCLFGMLTFSLMDILGLVYCQINEQRRPSGKSPSHIIFPRQPVFIRAAREGTEGISGGSKGKSRKKTTSQFH